MESVLLSSCQSLSIAQKKALEKAGLRTTSDILLLPLPEAARKLRLPPPQIALLIESVCRDISPQISCLRDTLEEEVISTGDARLNIFLNGGFRTGHIYDICGESASGKTQLALQLSLLIQLPRPCGLSGATAYINAGGPLSTTRLLQINAYHPLLAGSSEANLSRIHTSSCSSIQALIHMLSVTLPALALSLASSPHPLRLLVLDSLPPLLRTSTTSSVSLFERSKSLSHIGALLRSLCRQFGVAALILNEVSDIFERDSPRPAPPRSDGRPDLSYKDQARWFNADGFRAGKEASLGLVWANEVDGRLMMSRTNIRRHTETDGPRPSKRRKVDDHIAEDDEPRMEQELETHPVRRLAVIFNATSSPGTIDFIISEGGIIALESEVFASTGIPSGLPTDIIGKPSEISAAELELYARGLYALDFDYDEGEGQPTANDADELGVQAETTLGDIEGETMSHEEATP